MSRSISPLIRVFAVTLLAFAAATRGLPQDVHAESVEAAVARAIEGTLQQSAAVPHGTRLLRTTVQGQAVTVDLSREILDWGTDMEMEDALRAVLHAAGDAAGLAESDADFVVHIEGHPLDRILRELDDRDGPMREADVAPQASAATRVALSPGHGWYWHSGYRKWMLQRPLTLGVQEDYVNAELAMMLHASLRAAGIDSQPARDLSKSSGFGESGKPRWQEAALYYLRALGYPPQIWNTSANAYNSDINSRPLFANAIAAAACLSLHNNASKDAGAGTGTEIWIDSANGWQKDSERFARSLEVRVIGRIRSNWNGSWTNRGIKTCNGCLGENRLATRPAAIVELAFMDRAQPDNEALKSDAFRRIAVNGLLEGVQDFLGSASPAPAPTPTPAPQPTPTPRPAAPQITSVNPASVLGSEFTMTLQGAGFTSGATVLVYHPNGSYMGSGAITTRTTNRITARQSMAGAAPATYTVRARNANGDHSNAVSFRLFAQVYVGPTSGPAGTLFSYSGAGFTGNYGVTSHLRRPNGTEFPTLQIPTNPQGRFTHTVNSTGFAPGVYELWAEDNNTRHVTSRVSFRVQ